MFYEPVWDYEGYKLVRRPDTNRFYITWTNRRRYRRKSTGTCDAEEARKFLIRFAEDRRPGAKRRPNQAMVLDVLCDYVESLERRGSPTHWRTSLEKLGEFLKLEAIDTVAEFTPPLQDQYIAWRRSRLLASGHRASNGTILRDMSILRAAYNAAWKNGRLSEVPPVRTVPPAPPRERFLSESESRRLLAECHEPHLHLFVLMALHTLQRPGAILDLTIEQVDLARRRVDFNPPGRTRTRKGRPVVPITTTLLRPLVEAIEESMSGYVIEWDGHPVRSVRNSFNKARDRAGFGSDVTPYTLRHTGATLLAGAGVPMRQIAGMMGHATTITTELHYARHSPDFMGHATAALDDLFQEPKRLMPPDSEREAT